MIKCPKCGKELPDGTSFCLNCFSDITAKAVNEAESKAVKPEKTEKKEKKLLPILKSRQLRTVLSCFVIVALAVTGAVVLKRFVKLPAATVTTDDTTLITVTDVNGEAVTDTNGEALTELVDFVLACADESSRFSRL